MLTKTAPLFKEIMPFGGKLDENNRWIKLSQLVPWMELEEIYRGYFSSQKQSVLKSGQLILGLMIGKHVLKMSDRGVVAHYHENPYFQYFCGADSFASGSSKTVIHPSLLSKRRGQLGKGYFERFEREVLSVLVKSGVIKGETVAIDATVAPSHMEYPNDVKLMNVARSWMCDTILRVKNAINPKLKIRTYAQVARRIFLNYQKKKKKQRRLIDKTKKQMLRLMKRNIGQLTDLLTQYSDRNVAKTSRLAKHALSKICVHLKTAKSIYEQQFEMINKKICSIPDRIVNFHQPQIRPIVRGKEGKPVEFGPKILLSHIDGFAKLHHISHANFSENPMLEKSVEACKTLLGKMPKEILIDDGFSSHSNRKFLADHTISHSLKLIGKSTPEQKSKNRRRRAKRNQVEGLIGTLKNSFCLDKIKLRVQGGETIQTCLAFGTHNLMKAVARA